ncbi:spore germination protein GerPC [Sediminibacillus albus]|uniref:Spore germination protein PC n=1 Tax=Sediminibacillus albus TaxID=407036 RepID=A0A1G8XBT3_9BACI|nr:spore germination protein GerPC [Sediminibacillus albus]SDJ87807.1 spore germination protein PC [Sediminibacillus albus]
MTHPHYWEAYMAQLHQYIQQQDRRIRDLETRVTELENKKTNQTNVERIDYHFDQLKIERLDGTLHIGLSPDGLSNIEDMVVDQNQPYREQSTAAPSQQVVSALDQYVATETPKILHQLSQKYNHQLSPQQMEMVINDIRKQLPDRVAYHMENRENESDLSNIEEQIQEEINHSLHEFFHKGDFPL